MYALVLVLMILALVTRCFVKEKVSEVKKAQT